MVIKFLGGVVFIMLVVALLGVCIMVMERSIVRRERFRSFECGFDRFKSARVPFSLHFFIITIIFLVFDLEVLLMMPFIFLSKVRGGQVMVIGVVFFVVLLLGLWHEINEGGLEWS